MKCARGRGQGIQLPFADARPDGRRARAGANRSSMLQASRAGPTEIDAISGAVVRFAAGGVQPRSTSSLLRQMQARES